MTDAPFAFRFGHFVQSRRRELGITQEQLAETLGISQPAISSWERGGSSPTASALLGLLRALQLELADVVAILDGPDDEAAA